MLSKGSNQEQCSFVIAEEDEGLFKIAERRKEKNLEVKLKEDIL